MVNLIVDLTVHFRVSSVVDLMLNLQVCGQFSCLLIANPLVHFMVNLVVHFMRNQMVHG